MHPQVASRVDRAISRARAAAAAALDTAREQLRLTRAQRATWNLRLAEVSPPPLTARSSAPPTPDARAAACAVGHACACGPGGVSAADSGELASLLMAGSAAGSGIGTTTADAAERAARAR